MKVIVLSNGELVAKEIDSGLRSLQKIVNGYIEVPFLSKVFADNGIDVIINEEGKLIKGMLPEIAVVEKRTGRVIDIVYGNCVFASHDDQGYTIGLNRKQAEIVLKELNIIMELMNRNTHEEYEVRVLYI